jgi:hypothetical protein
MSAAPTFSVNARQPTSSILAGPCMVCELADRLVAAGPAKASHSGAHYGRVCDCAKSDAACLLIWREGSSD